ncbi:MAG: L,D-transpeptidase [Planctomycetes bacterium]|nr:L,D-transpeptidase [Planctomycetota bacterium]MCB9910870.1 L,D-transpeptidase [Planctomycetota bacterium]MCB9912081.1 L,D-transpeptidase [Planctomycetota bacterium]
MDLDPRLDDVAITDASARRFDLGPTGGESGALAQALIEAWIRQDPTLLQGVLDGNHGSQAAQDQARLTGMFWQAMVGRPEVAREAWTSLMESGNATPAQMEMLKAAIEFDAVPNVPEQAGRHDPLARSMRMVLLESAAGRYQDTAHYDDAARSLSELMNSEVHAPWAPHREALVSWAERLNTAQNNYRLSPRGDWPSITYRVEPNDSLELIRKRLVQDNPGLLLCTGLIAKVNQTGQYIHAGDVLRIPTEPSNMLVDLDARMAFYRHGNEIVRAWTVGIGKEGKDTPVGTYTIGDKLKEPVWTRRNKPALPYGHPENLLGARWLGWYQDGIKTDYGFHGTNDESGVGDRVSSGCIRMRNLDVEELFELLPQGAQVVVQP